MQALKGTATAAAIREQIVRDVTALAAQGVRVQLAVMRVGERPDDVAYAGRWCCRRIALRSDACRPCGN